LWPDSPLSHTFIASMQAAIAAAMLWIGITGELSVLAAGALNLMVMMGGLAVSFVGMARQPAYGYLRTYAIICALFAIANLLLFVWSRNIPMRSTLPMPRLVRISYVIFIIALTVVGVALIMRIPNVLPWPLNTPWDNTFRDDSVVFGWMFLGDAFYFLYALRYPQWHRASAQLWSFLAYDLVLLGPFLRLIYTGQVKPEFKNSLLVYTAILIYSTLLALYYLLLKRPERNTAQRRVNPYELQQS
ncbi:MAG: hypothetical protein NT075_01680, partial [Chloroflexi bacterium]|nr:hypothetical protein [Chloroflexota bacterium]